MKGAAPVIVIAHLLAPTRPDVSIEDIRELSGGRRDVPLIPLYNHDAARIPTHRLRQSKRRKLQRRAGAFRR